MKQVNLKEFNIEEVRFTVWTSLTDDLLEKIQSVVAPDKDGDYVFMESYKIGNVGHFVFAMVSELKGEGIYRIGVICEKRGRRLRKGIASVSKLLEIISSIKEEMRVMCVLSLSFGRRKKYKTIISLPIKITDMPKTLYNEIHGFHFAKREGKDLKYDVVVDIERDGTLIELINFIKVINIKESILEDIIQEGIEISDGFIVREKQ
jgi:hypothetical protein